MNSFIVFLNNNKLTAGIILLIYYLLVVLLHEQVSDLFIKIVKGVPRDVYQSVVLSIGAFFLLAYIVVILRNIIRRVWRSYIIFYLLFTLLYVVLSFEIIIVHNIEIIHFAQYTVLAILIYPFVRRFGDTVFWATILGFVDEAYQYLYLKPDGTDYFDFNDVILNLIGAGLGVVLIFSSGFTVFRSEKKMWYKSPVNITSIIVLLGAVTLFLTSVITVYPSEEISHCLVVLIKEKKFGFWETVSSLNTRFHIVRPLEGTIIILLMLMFYYSIDRVTNKIIQRL